MSKRGADNYMTDQNWDQEEELEEAGVFKQADKTTIGRRVIKKATRKTASEHSTETEDGAGGSTFKGFTGFSGFSKTTDTASVFGNLGSKTLTFTNGPTPPTDAPKTSLFALAKSTDSVLQPNDPKDSQNHIKPPTLTNGNGDSKSVSSAKSKYANELKTLNEGVTKWIKEHVDKNPYCILSPIFKDYEKYLSDLENKYPQRNQERGTSGDTEADKETGSDEVKEVPSPPKSTPKFSFGNVDTKIVEASGGFSASETTSTTSSTTTITTSPPDPIFSFNKKSQDSNSRPLGVAPTKEISSENISATGSASTGIFGSSSTSSTSSTFSGFGGFGQKGMSGSVFGSGTSGSGFSFGMATKKPDEGGTSSAADTEEEYVPPKDEVAVVQESDAVYTKRCKLFFKRDDQWKEKGVGNLHLKPCGDKTQLLIRADTNLGNILLNIMLSSSLPVSRQGKNNVTLVCVPNPAIDGIEEKTMVPMLVRVKTAEDADKLFEKLKEHKS